MALGEGELLVTAGFLSQRASKALVVSSNLARTSCWAPAKSPLIQYTTTFKWSHRTCPSCAMERWINSLWPTDAIWCRGSGSSLVQMMAYCVFGAKFTSWNNAYNKPHLVMLPSKCWPFWFGVIVLTHWGRDKMAAIFQTTFSNGFSWMKMYGFRLTSHWSLFLEVQLTIFQHWFR